MGYRLTAAADTDLWHIATESAQAFGSSQALAYGQGLRRSLELLAKNPRMARERTEIAPPMHVHPYGSHLIFYYIDGADIVVVRIRHGRENWLEE